jgi:hypothetical protein
MNGMVPESIGQLVLLKYLYLGYKLNSNMFVGPLPSSMSKLIILEALYLNVETLAGPLPDLSQLVRLDECAFTPSQMCHLPYFVPLGIKCNFTVLPTCDSYVKITDCEILEEWLPTIFDSFTCCQADGVTCEEDRVVILDLSKTETKKHITGVIPKSFGGLKNLQQLYLHLSSLGLHQTGIYHYQMTFRQKANRLLKHQTFLRKSPQMRATSVSKSSQEYLLDLSSLFFSSLQL